MKKKVYKTIDLFAGIGGIRKGFEQTEKFKTVYANDFDEKCKITYDLNFDDAQVRIKDIRDLKSDELPEFDLLLGGFPCQAFSIAGYRQGFQDEKGRGNLFFEIERILDERKPEAFMLENVKNLKTHDHGNTFKVISESLTKLGYHFKVDILNAMEYGNVPQNRERIYIVGFKSIDAYNHFKFPDKIKLTKSIKDVLEKTTEAKYHYNNKLLFSKLVDEVKDEGVAYQWRRKYVRENKSKVFPTLTANMGMGGHNVPIIKQGNIIRKITPLECARIQGFPDDYKLPENIISDSYLYKQFGNSVCVPVVQRIAENIYDALTNDIH
jgi:DNA (cytosine-5)-methyltransferase 1